MHTSFYDAHWSGTQELTDREKERVVSTLAAIPSDIRSVIDVGCGDGRISNALVDKGLDVTAVDISSVALSHVRAKTAQRSAGELGNLSADLIVSTEMVEHLPPDIFEKARVEFARCAARYILITVPNRENLSEHLAYCKKCDRPFHIWGHERSFDAHPITLFPGFELVKSVAFGEAEVRWNRWLLWLWHKCGGWATAETCYHCGNPTPSIPEGIAAKVIRALQYRIWARVAQPKKSWLLLLYSRHQNGTPAAATLF